MLTKYERELVDYYKNWKPGMKPFKAKHNEEEKVKHTKKSKKEKKSPREFMEEMQFELGLSEEELDDLLIPEEEWDDLEEQ
ncbi:MAG: hypothetical protein ACI4VQ_01220 [Clostridia bacterium]